MKSLVRFSKISAFAYLMFSGLFHFLLIYFISIANSGWLADGVRLSLGQKVSGKSFEGAGFNSQNRTELQEFQLQESGKVQGQPLPALKNQIAVSSRSAGDGQANLNGLGLSDGRGLGGDFHPAIPILEEDFEYPELARQQSLEGRVEALLNVGDTGRVDSFEMLYVEHEIFLDSAQRGLRKLIFKPARQGGHPIPTKVKYVYRFQLKTVVDQPSPKESL